MTREQAILDAQRTANRTGKPVCVFNLNRVGVPLYVLRHSDLLESPDMVKRCNPETTEQGG